MPTATSTTPFRVAIVGGGLGGLITALCINHHVRDAPIEINVYEQANEYKEIGAGIGLGPNANVLFHNIGIAKDIIEIAGNRNGIWITFRRYDNGAEVFTVRPDIETEVIRNVPCSRSELLDVLVRNINDRKAATLHTNKCCTSLHDHGDTVKLTFKDATTTEANLVIACDGIHSALRSQFARDNPIYSGIVAYRGVIPTSTLHSPWPFPTYSVLWMGKGKHFLCYPLSRNKLLNIFACVTTPESSIPSLAESWTETCPRSQLEKDFDSFDPVVKHIISQLPDPTSKWKLNYRDPLNQWVYLNGRAVLVGDAAHPMTPHQGAGGGQVVEDAYVLSKALAAYLSQHQQSSNTGEGSHSLADYMQLYQTVRLPRAQMVAKTSKIAGETYEQATPDLLDVPYDEGLEVVKERVMSRMKWIWNETLDDVYERTKKEAGLA